MTEVEYMGVALDKVYAAMVPASDYRQCCHCDLWFDATREGWGQSCQRCFDEIVRQDEEPEDVDDDGAREAHINIKKVM